MGQHCKALGDCSSLPVRAVCDELSSQGRANGSIKVRSVQLEDDVATATACSEGGGWLRLSWGKMRDP